MCLITTQRPNTVNGFLALQEPHIVPYRLSQCQLVRETLRACLRLTPRHTRLLSPSRYDTHTLTQQPLAAFPHFLCLRHGHRDISQPGWHGDPPVTLSGHLGPPRHPMGRGFFFSMPPWQYIKPPGTVPPPSLHMTVFFLRFFC